MLATNQMLILKFTIGINNPEDYDPCWECPEKKDKVAKDRDLKPGGDKTTIENHHHHHHETRVVPGPVSTVPVTMAPMNMMPMTVIADPDYCQCFFGAFVCTCEGTACH